jgi:UDP-N-acetyl-2-amino-2-deoxyglucuronate dehydrogenase
MYVHLGTPGAQMEAMSAIYGYGIIGCGWVASAHAWGIRSLHDDDVRLVAVADKDLQRAEQLAGEFGIEVVYADYRDLLARSDINAISVCLPDWLHREVTVAAARAGKHVLCEKPLALDLAGANEMVRECARSGVELGLIMNHRYFPDNIRARQIIGEGALGRPLFGSVIHASGLTGNANGTSPWRGRRGLAAGGVLSTQAIHFLDLLLWFAGPVGAVKAWTKTLVLGDQQDHEDTAAIALRLQSGALATLVTSSGSPIMDDFTGTRIEVHGSDGYLMLEGDRLRMLQTRKDYAVPDVKLPQVPEGAQGVLFGVGHIYEVADFVKAVREGREPPVPGTDGRHLMAVLDAAYASARGSEEISISEASSGYGTGGDTNSLLYTSLV